MFTYVVKRLFLMVPTLFGISMILWLIMVAAPGRPGTAAAGVGDAAGAVDPTKERAKGESQRIFRRHFALDRPVFWNSWPSLEDDEVLRAVNTSLAPIETTGVAAKREARESLEDWGDYAVPPLVRLLSSTAGDAAVQDRVLYWLRLNSVRVPEATFGRTLDEPTIRRNQNWAKQNVEISKYAWKPEDPPTRRSEVVGLWQAWFEREKAERFEWSGTTSLKVALTDTQFATYWGRMLRLDLGISHAHRRPVIDLIAERLPISLSLSLVSILLVYLLAIPLGIFSAVRPYTLEDRTTTVLLFLLYSLPSFFVGTILLRWLTVGEPFRWFPHSGLESRGADDWNSWERLKDLLWHSTLPIVVMTYGGLAGLSRFMRTGMLDVIRSDYIRTARAKGLSESTVILRHAARNGVMPIVTILGATLPALIGGSVIVEFIFNIQGMGSLLLDAITNKDYNVVMGESMIVAVLTLIGFLISDILYAVLDPRISFS